MAVSLLAVVPVSSCKVNHFTVDHVYEVCVTNRSCPLTLTFGRMVKNLCLCIKVTEAEDEEFRIIHAMQLSPERLYFRID